MWSSLNLVDWRQYEIHILTPKEIIMNKQVWNFNISSFALQTVIVKNVACSPENS